MRILFIGDVVGAAGMTAVKSMLPDAISRWEVDLAVVNGENSAGTGFGITEDTYQGIRGAGANVVTLGNHSWNCKEALSFIGTEPRLVRPLNYVPGMPGQGFVRVETVGGKRVLVLNALGHRTHKSEPYSDCGEFDDGEIIGVVFFVAGRHRAEMFEFVEEAFDEVSEAIEIGAEGGFTRLGIGLMLPQAPWLARLFLRASLS